MKRLVVKNEPNVTWLGRDFYYAVVDTVYVKQPSTATRHSSIAARHSRLDRESRSGMTFSVENVPGSVPYTEQTIIRPDGTRTTTRYEGIVSDLPLC